MISIISVISQLGISLSILWKSLEIKEIRNPQSEICNPQSEIRNPQSEIHNPQFAI